MAPGLATFLLHWKTSAGPFSTNLFSAIFSRLPLSLICNAIDHGISTTVHPQGQFKAQRVCVIVSCVLRGLTKATFSQSVFWIESHVYQQMWLSNSPVHTTAYRSISNTVCMNKYLKSRSFAVVTIAMNNRDCTSIILENSGQPIRLSQKSNLYIMTSQLAAIHFIASKVAEHCILTEATVHRFVIYSRLFLSCAHTDPASIFNTHFHLIITEQTTMLRYMGFLSAYLSLFLSLPPSVSLSLRQKHTFTWCCVSL